MKFVILLSVFCLSLLSTRAAKLQTGPVVLENHLTEEEIEQIKAIISRKKDLPGTPEIKAIVNDFGDKTLINIDALLNTFGFEPTELPEIHRKIQFVLSFGELHLKNGAASNLSTLRREGDCIVRYVHDTKTLFVKVPLAFDNIEMIYDYKVKILYIGPSGAVTASVKHFAMNVELAFDLENYNASLVKYKVTDSGHFAIGFQGNVLIDWLLEIVTNTVTVVFKEVIIIVIDLIVRGTLESVLEALNDIVAQIVKHPESGDTFARYMLAYSYA